MNLANLEQAEKIRAARLARNEPKAQRYEEWAEKRRAKAAVLHKQNEPFRGDWALATQPGHIPERARMNRREERAWEHEREAARMEGKARDLRNVRVAGDAKRKREAGKPYREELRAKTREWLRVGIRVRSDVGGTGVVTRINRKTATIDAGETRLGRVVTREDLMFLHEELGTG